MDKLTIFNKALSVYNQEPLGEDELSDLQNPEVAVMDLNLGTALRKASREMDWSFLEVELQFESDPTTGTPKDYGSRGGYAHSFKLPDGLFRLTSADGDRYKRMAYIIVPDGVGGSKRVTNILLTDGKAEAQGIMDVPPEEGVPEDFWDLVAYALAYFCSGKLSPGDKKAMTAMQSYQAILQTMIANECQSESLEMME